MATESGCIVQNYRRGGKPIRLKFWKHELRDKKECVFVQKLLGYSCKNVLGAKKLVFRNSVFAKVAIPEFGLSVFSAPLVKFSEVPENEMGRPNFI